MSDPELRRTLMELRRELADVDDVDDELDTLLAEIREDIDAVMERAAPHTFVERLSEAVKRFEASHPSLAAAMGAVLDQFARMGV